MRGVNGPAALCEYRAAVGATGGSSKCGSLNVMEWLQPREEQAVEVALQPVFLCMPNLLPLR